MFPPEIDVDEIAEEENIVNSNSVHLLGPGLLGECSQIDILTRGNERKEIAIETSAKARKEPKHKKLKVEKPKRSWHPIQFQEEREEHTQFKIKNKVQSQPNVVEEMIASGGGPIYFCKLFWSWEFVEQICSESQK